VILRFWALAFCAVSGVAWADPAPVTLSKQASDLIAPVHAAFEKAREGCEFDRMKDVSAKLGCLGRLDQAGRVALHSFDLTSLPPEQRLDASAAIWAEITAQDLIDQTVLKSLLPAKGWFAKSSYGIESSEAAWSVVQHATEDMPLMRMALERLSTDRSDVSADDYAKLYDRVQMMDGKKQLYGTQFKCVDHKWALYPVQGPDRVDDRRKALGMSDTQAETEKTIEAFPPCYFKAK